MMATLDSRDFTIPGSVESQGLALTLTRYRDPRMSLKSGGMSILMLHGTSYHKETWLPTVEHIFNLQNQAAQKRDQIVLEVWVLDAPNHGRAAIINDAQFSTRPEVTVREFGRDIQIVINSGLLEGSSVIAMAHSAAIPAMISSTVDFHSGKIPYVQMVLVEPALPTRELYAKMMKKGDVFKLMSSIARERRDIWPSRHAAREWMAKRIPWSSWTPRCLDLFIEYAIRDLPTATYPDRTDGVTLCCTRLHEAQTYEHDVNVLFQTFDRLGELCPEIPVHCIYGADLDLIPEIFRTAFLRSKQCRNLASVITVPDAGHLIVQQNPEGLARATWDILHKNASVRARDIGLQSRL